MGELPPEHREAVRDAQYTLMIDGDYTRIVRAWQRIGILTADVGPVEDVAARLKAVLDPWFDMAIGEVSLAELLRQQVELQREYGARAVRELVLVSKQLMYFERYARELAPAYTMARDLFLMVNVFPEEVAKAAADRGVVLPDDAVPHVRPPA
jgi:predicted unusual protein kinase regulating ubiquinone biosynthesis (AarF/ABC1/UbiB family)